MKKMALVFMLCFYGIVTAQTNHPNRIGFAYTTILNSNPVFSIYDGLVANRFVHKLNFNFIIEKENKSKRLIGLSYSLFNGSSTVTKQIYDSYYNNYVNYTEFHQQVLHQINFHYGYQFKPFNKKENFCLEIFSEPGIALYKSTFEFNPEKIYLGLTNSVFKKSFFSFFGGIRLINSFNVNEMIRLNLNYGLIYQLVSTKHENICGFAGIGLEF